MLNLIGHKFTTPNNFYGNKEDLMLVSQDGSLILTMVEEGLPSSTVLDNLPIAREEKTEDRYICIWDTSKQSFVKELRLSGERYRPIAFAGNEKIIVDNSGILQVWDIEKEKVVREFISDRHAREGFFFCYDFNPKNNKALIYPGLVNPFLWDIKANEIESCNFPFTFMENHYISNDGSAFVFMTRATSPRGYKIDETQDQEYAPSVVVIDRNTGKFVKGAGEKLLINPKAYEYPFPTTQYIREKEKTVVVGYSSGLIREYDLVSGKTITTFQETGNHVLEVFEDCNGRLISIEEKESHISFWDKKGTKTGTMKIAFEWNEEADDDGINYPSYLYPKDGRYLVYLSNLMKQLNVIDLKLDTTEKLEIFDQFSSTGVSMIALQNDQVFLTGTDGSIQSVEILLT